MAVFMTRGFLAWVSLHREPKYSGYTLGPAVLRHSHTHKYIYTYIYIYVYIIFCKYIFLCRKFMSLGCVGNVTGQYFHCGAALCE